MDITAAVLISFLVGYALLWAPIAWIGCALFSWFLAREKGYSGFTWFLLGLLFGPASLVATAGLPDRTVHASPVSSYGKLEPRISG